MEYIIPSDRIVAGTYLLGALITRGDAKASHRQCSIWDTPHLLEQMGAVVESGKDWIHVQMEKRCRPIPNIVTAPFPGFSTDLQSALMAVLSTADGISFVEEKIFEARFQIVPELMKMGASIVNQDSFALIEGVRRLSGAKVQARELRGGAGLIMAGTGSRRGDCYGRHGICAPGL